MKTALTSILAAAATLLVGGCGSPESGNPTGPRETLSLGQQTYALDQLAPAPDDGSGAHLVYAVIQLTTSAAQHIAREDAFTLVDRSGRRYRAVQPTVYVPIDHLDGLTVSPDHAGAGVVAFPVPAEAAAEILVSDGGSSGVLHAP